jgi:hypothetical protein
MEEKKVQLSPQEQEGQESVPSLSLGKKPWQEPKLAFVEPKLTKHGKLEEVTGQTFFRGFSPDP